MLDEWLIPIKIIHPDICFHCGEMSIDNDQMEILEGDTKSYINRLKCSHYERCKGLWERMKNTQGTHDEHA